MPRPRRWTDDQLEDAVARAANLREVCAILAITVGGKTYTELRTRAIELGLDLARFGLVGELVRERDRRRLPATDEEVRAAVEVSWTFSDVCRNLGILPEGGNFATVRRRIEKLGLSTAHFTHEHWRRAAAARQRERRAVPLDKLLVVGRGTSSTGVRQRLLREGIKEARCESCRLAEWNGQPIALELDHINGRSDDNRLENLRLLCPNCHAQTDTWRGRNIGRYRPLEPSQPEEQLLLTLELAV